MKKILPNGSFSAFMMACQAEEKGANPNSNGSSDCSDATDFQ
ncbi:hypothetical protein [Gracilibacillus phocaeensis]|nr:hypothetical protein [Gracilibacillus phocaeensis]